MANNGSIADYLNKFNMMTSRLESIGINFNDEIKVPILLSSLPETWDGLVMKVNNFCGTTTLKFDDPMGVLSEEARRKSSGAACLLYTSPSPRDS